MGLLDMFNNPESAGLLGAAAQILERSGDPSRPYGIGQAMGTGINAYMQTNATMRARKLQEEQEKQQQAMREMQMQEMQAQQLQAQAGQARAAKVQEYLSKGMQSAPQMPMGGFLQQQQQVQAPQQGMPGPLDPYSQRMQKAAYLRQGDFGQEADAEEMNALKFQPKVKNWQEVQVGGKVMYAPYFEDGNVGEPVPLEIARKLINVDSGQSNDMVDSYTGQIKTSIRKKQTLESLASNANAAASRAQADRHFNISDERERMSMGSSGKAPTGYRWAPNGELEAIPGGPAGNKATTSEGERKAATLLKRLEGSQAQLATALTDNPDAAKPGVVASGLRSLGQESLANTVAVGPERQRVESAQLDILDAALTLGTGAAYTREQLEGYRKSYFPQLGDKADNIADKKKRLQNVIDAAKIAAGRAAPKAAATEGAQPARKSVMKGQVIDGYRFKGGDPSDQNNWELK